MASNKKKMFVLDTNVILHDSSCLHQFQENDLVIPLIVLEELDQFKKGSDSLSYHAREFVRSLDELGADKLFNGGVRLGEGLGKISLKLDRQMHPDLAHNFPQGKADHSILNTAYYLSLENRARQVILVSKDVNLRMKAKAAGLPAQDYFNDRIHDLSTLYSGSRVEDITDDRIIDKLYSEPNMISVDELKTQKPFAANEYVILKNNRKSGLATYDLTTNALKKVNKIQAYGIKPRNAEQTFAFNALLNDNLKLVTVTGKAGTGKTLLALAAALENRKEYRQIFISRPVVPLSNKDIGFLPGDIKAKLDPYIQPLYDNLGVIQNQFPDSDTKNKRIREFLETEKLIVQPLTYIRGRSLSKIYFIVDEAQNLTPHEIKTIVTRAADGTKLVFTGDIFQIDHPYLNSYSNGLSYIIDKMKGQKLFAHINLEKGERSELAELASNLL